MTDVEARLREHLHDRLDPLEAGSLLPAQVLRSGRRARRIRTTAIAAAVAVIVTGGATGAVLAMGGRDRAAVVPATGLSERTVAYARQIAGEDYGPIRDDMTDRTRDALTEERFRDVWARVVDALGPYESVGAPVVEPQPPGTTVRVPLRFRHGVADLRVTYRGDGKVIGVTLLVGSGAPTAASAGLERAAREVVADLAAGRWAEVRSRFDETMTDALSEDRLRASWEAVAEARYDGFVRVEQVTTSTVGAHAVLDVLCEMRNGRLRVRVAFDREERISGLFLLAP